MRSDLHSKRTILAVYILKGLAGVGWKCYSDAGQGCLDQRSDSGGQEQGLNLEVFRRNCVRLDVGEGGMRETSSMTGCRGLAAL